jgi:hypothetical protein
MDDCARGQTVARDELSIPRRTSALWLRWVTDVVLHRIAYKKLVRA